MLRSSRQRARAGLQRLRRRAPPVAPTLPPYAPILQRLAYLAVGDADSAAALTAALLLEGPATFGAAVRLLHARLPDGWLSWPGEAGPAEWLALRLRPEQAHRLLSMLGEWRPHERLALALYLEQDVRRDELDAWLGSTGMAERLSTALSALGARLGLVPPGGSSATCQALALDLVDHDHDQIDPMVRRHCAVCAACQARRAGLIRTRHLLATALRVSFRATPPPLTPLLQREGERRRRHRQARWRRLALLPALLLLLGAVLQQPAPPPPSTTAPPGDARAIIARALRRFDTPPRHSGILHERATINRRGTPLTIERWFDYRPPHRLRLTVRRTDRATPILDLAANGPDRLTYLFDPVIGRPHGGTLRNADLTRLMPLLAQLPATGTLGMMPVPQQDLDLSLLAEAWRGDPALLGSTRWRDRPAWLIIADTADQQRLTLTIDQATLSLLEARHSAASAGVASAAQRWRVETIAVLPDEAVPNGQFVLPPQTAIDAVDPRQLLRPPLAELSLPAAARLTLMAVPDTLPEAPLLAFIRNRAGLRTSIYQVYEGRWSTLIITAPPIFPPLEPRPLPLRTENGRYALMETTLPQTTALEFTLDAAPKRRMRLYLWHLLADDAAREALAVQTLRSLRLIEPATADRAAVRFLEPSRSVGSRLQHVPPTQP